MSKTELTKRYLLFIISLFFSGLGVALTKYAGLGVSPISSSANVMSIRFPVLSMGTWLLIWNLILILGQILILQKNFQKIQLLQIPLSVLFGWFTDIGLMIASLIPISGYVSQLATVLLGVCTVAFGISLAVIANVIMNSGEAFVKAVADTFQKNFGNVKTFFDLGCLACGIILSLIFFDFTIVGVREGTILSALCTGSVVKFYGSKLSKPVNALVSDRK